MYLDFIYPFWYSSRFFEMRYLSNPKCCWLPFLPLFMTHVFLLSFGFKPRCIVINFLVLWFIFLSSTIVYFKNGTEFLTEETVQVFIPLMMFLLLSVVSRNFLILLMYHHCYHDHHHHVTLLAQISLTLSLSLSIHSNHSFFPIGPPVYIQCPHRAVVRKFLLVGPYWHVHEKGFIGDR